MLYFSLAYGLFTIVGGLIGFLKVGSTTSLLAGSLSGALIIASALAYIRGRMIGFYGLIVLSIALFGWFLKGYLATGKVMPALIMVVLSAANLAGVLLFKRPNQHTALR